jgi:colanic acid/amylovoran/stewartan biosynthesis glycosyltransferase WcaL/AmsK/CpsK
MRVAVFVESFPMVSETFILRQVTGLLDRRHQVDVFANTRPATGTPVHPEVSQYDLPARTFYMDMPPETGCFEMPVWPVLGRTWAPGASTSIPNVVRLARAAPRLLRCLAAAPRVTLRVLDHRDYGHQADSLSALYRLAHLCARRRRYDVLHAHFGPVGNSFRFAKELWEAPLLVSFHGYDFCTVPRKDGPRVYHRLFDAADGVTYNSEHTRGRLLELGCPADKLHKLPVGVDLSLFPYRERSRTPGEPVRLLTVGRLVEKKGVEYSVRAVARVATRHLDLRYDIVGDGPLRARLEATIRDLGLERVVTLHGARDGEFVRRLMNAAHLFVLASVTAANGDQEGQGLVLQEAQAAGIPVVATDHNGFPESIVPDESGFLVPERDVESLADRLSNLIAHPEIWPALGRRGREHVEALYDIRRLNDRLVDLYKLIRSGVGRVRTNHNVSR